MQSDKWLRRIVPALGGAIYALFAAFGWQAEHYGESRIAQGLLVSAALALPAMAVLWFLLERSRKNAGQARAAGVFSLKKTFLLILVCYVPMFLIAYPGSFAYDVPFQLEQVFTGTYSTHHPLLHTLLMGVCVKLGHAVGRINSGATCRSLLP